MSRNNRENLKFRIEKDENDLECCGNSGNCSNCGQCFGESSDPVRTCIVLIVICILVLLMLPVAGFVGEAGYIIRKKTKMKDKVLWGLWSLLNAAASIGIGYLVVTRTYSTSICSSRYLCSYFANSDSNYTSIECVQQYNTNNCHQVSWVPYLLAYCVGGGAGVLTFNLPLAYQAIRRLIQNRPRGSRSDDIKALEVKEIKGIKEIKTPTRLTRDDFLTGLWQIPITGSSHRRYSFPSFSEKSEKKEGVKENSLELSDPGNVETDSMTIHTPY